MRQSILILAVCLVLAGCAGSKKDAAEKQREAKPVESLLTTADMNECEQEQGVMPPKAAADVYAMPEDSIDKIKDCAFEKEKLRMPLVADLIDKYRGMLQQGNKECAKDIGTHYAASCMKDSVNGAAEWYNLAVAQKLLSAMPNQPQVQVQTGKP